MNFDKFKASFEVKNNHLKIILVLSSIIFSFSTFLIATQRRYFIYAGGEIFKDRPLSIEICRLGFMSIVTGSPNSYVVTDSILELLKRESFLLEIEEILALKSLDEDKCKIILKSDGELLAFTIGLDKSEMYPFYYKLAQVDEINPKENL